MKKEVNNDKDLWFEKLYDLRRKIKEAGIKKEVMRKYNDIVRMMKLYDDHSNKWDLSGMEKEEMFLKIWIIQKKINWNSEKINEVVFEFIDNDEEMDMVELKKLKEERRKLFEERNKLEDILNEPEAINEMIEYLSK